MIKGENGAAGVESEELGRINQALEASYNAHSSNETRHAALHYLDSLKKQPAAPQYGYSLASDQSQQPSARHFGLSLLEGAVRYQWDTYSEDQALTLREWVISLARQVSPGDPAYFRNKIASLWIEVAKRDWAGSWLNMDEMLDTLWHEADGSKDSVNKMLVLSILEGLSEDICNREDAVAGLRQDMLGQALNEIIIPQALYEAHLETRGTNQEVRHTKNGWLDIMCKFTSSCLHSASATDEATISCLIRTLEALKPTVTWMSLQAIVETQCVQHLFQTLASPSAVVKTVTTEVLYGILSRQYNPHFHAPWDIIMRSALQLDCIQLLTTVHFASRTSAEDIDQEKYTLQKKLSELLSVLGDVTALNPELFDSIDQIHAILELLLIALPSESLLVSIPVLHSFTRLVETKHLALSRPISNIVGSLLQICSERLLRYEYLPTDSDEPIVLYLQEDFEDLPEQHAFLGNYRRYCVAIIESVARTKPSEAVVYIFDQTSLMAEQISASTQAQSQPSTYVKTSLPVLHFEAQAVVVKSVLNGYLQWYAHNTQATKGALTAENEQERSTIVQHLEIWCRRQLDSHPDHPDIARLSIQILVNVVTKILESRSELILETANYLLALPPNTDSSYSEHMEAVQAYQSTRLHELQRIAIGYPDYLFSVYNGLEAKIGSMTQAAEVDQHTRYGLQSLLMTTLLRTTHLDERTRVDRLQDMLRPIERAWQDAALTESLSSFAPFCAALGLQDLPEYLSSRRFNDIPDWAAQQLDQEGKQHQATISSRLWSLPLRMTVTMLGASTDKIGGYSAQSEVARTVWKPIIQAILPNVLAMTSRASEFSNAENWSSISTELQAVVQKMLVDRFWQSGISNESKDDFTARISGSSQTYEGFASTVRGSPRQIRELCYHIIYGMARFEEEFYGIEGLAPALAPALLGEAHWMTTHHLQRLVSLIEKLVQRCPPHHRQQFLPPVLTLFFSQLDRKISSEWAIIQKVQAKTTESDQLGEEMRIESVLRTTTHSTIVFLSTLLEPTPPPDVPAGPTTVDYPSLRTLVLSDPAVLEPLILFCTHALGMRDKRCCTLICRNLRSITPAFTSDMPPSPQVREFISTEVLKAAITSLNEPYFADVQRDLANLIASIVHLYAPKTPTPRDVLLSLPSMPHAKVDKAMQKICTVDSERQQRALVLDLLEGVRGVSIHEAGRIERPGGGGGRHKRSALQQHFMELEQKRALQRGRSPGLDGVADMFGS